MKGTHHHKAVLIKEFAVLACDLEIRIDQRAGGDAPEADDDFWPDELNLRRADMASGFDLVAFQVPVFWAGGILPYW